jgi:hypothetical protein
MSGSAWGRLGWGPCIAACALSVVLGCDSGHPDSGYGAAAPVPATKTCADLCARIADCGVALCDEDSMSTKYSVTREPIDTECLSTCTDDQVQSMISDPAWGCTFRDSCRQVFENDLCHGHARYSCDPL